MAKTNMAKVNVIERLKQAFGEDYIGEYNGKHYVWVKDDNEKVQISISLTQPKIPVVGPAIENSINFAEYAAPAAAPAAPTPAAEITAEEQANIQSLLEKLGL